MLDAMMGVVEQLAVDGDGYENEREGGDERPALYSDSASPLLTGDSCRNGGEISIHP